MNDRRYSSWRMLLLVSATLAMTACSSSSPTPTSSPTLTQSSSSTGPASNTSIATISVVTTVNSTSLSTAPSTPTESSAAATEPEATAAPSDQPSANEPSPDETSPDETSYSGAVSAIDQATASRMSTSWHPGCPVALADLRYVTVTYRGFDGTDHQGELVVAASVANDVLGIFRALYDADYPIASLQLVDNFGGSDDDSMAANNSSAFNCRPVTGGGGFSEHSYGTAIDLNPVQNPYLSGSLVLPEQGRDFVDRHPAPGVIEPGDAVVTAFADHGWTWGGTWSGPVDYQHFSVSGR